MCLDFIRMNPISEVCLFVCLVRAAVVAVAVTVKILNVYRRCTVHVEALLLLREANLKMRDQWNPLEGSSVGSEGRFLLIFLGAGTPVECQSGDETKIEI